MFVRLSSLIKRLPARQEKKEANSPVDTVSCWCSTKLIDPATILIQVYGVPICDPTCLRKAEQQQQTFWEELRA